MPGDGGTDDFCWDALEPRVLHPVRVEIIEALRWIGLPLSATDLLWVFEGQQTELRLEYHLRLLSELDVVKKEAGGMTPPLMGQRPYRLVEGPDL
ncbi:MAG: hypothetical protein ABW196_02375 [Solirubrobacterales bacterium]